MRLYLENTDEVLKSDKFYWVYCTTGFCSVTQVAYDKIKNCGYHKCAVFNCHEGLNWELDLQSEEDCGDLDSVFTTLDEAMAHAREFADEYAHEIELNLIGEDLFSKEKIPQKYVVKWVN